MSSIRLPVMARKSKLTLEQLVDGIDLPHKRFEGWQWMQVGAAPANKPAFSRDRLLYYAGELRKLGMRDADISCLISDLYWDSFTEAEKNGIFKKFKAK